MFAAKIWMDISAGDLSPHARSLVICYVIRRVLMFGTRAMCHILHEHQQSRVRTTSGLYSFVLTEDRGVFLLASGQNHNLVCVERTCSFTTHSIAPHKMCSKPKQINSTGEVPNGLALCLSHSIASVRRPSTLHLWKHSLLFCR